MLFTRSGLVALTAVLVPIRMETVCKLESSINIYNSCWKGGDCLLWDEIINRSFMNSKNVAKVVL